MAINASHVSVAVNGDIRWTGDTTTYTVLELHRYLQDLADNAGVTGDDLLDITSSTPSERSTDNIISLLGTYNIDDTMAEHLYDGSISQAGGNTLYSGLVVVGSTFSTTTLKIVQDNAFYDDQASPFWGTNLNADSGANILMRCMVKTRDSGADIDGKRIRVQARELGDTYAEFSVTMGLGNSVAAIFTNEDLNNATAAGTISGWTITNTEGYQTIDLENGEGAQPYYSQWVPGTQSINDLYEYTKWIQRSGTSETIHGINGELFRGITHEYNFDTVTGSAFVEDDIITWTGGSGLLLALDDNTTTGTVWMQLLSGTAPTDGTVVTNEATDGTHALNGSVTSRTLSPAFIGQSTGSALIGAFGIGVTLADLSSNDKLFDLTNTLRTPPNIVTFEVSGLESGEDRVLVGPKDTGNAFKVDQLSATNTETGTGVTSIVVDEAIPSDTPTTGTIRVQLDDGTYLRVAYSGWATSTFTITSTDFDGVDKGITAGANVWISYIDKLADASTAQFTTKYSSDRNLYVRVRDGGTAGDAIGIKTFESPSTLGSGGGSIAAIRTDDA